MWGDSDDVDVPGGRGPECTGLGKLPEQSEVLKNGRHRGGRSCRTRPFHALLGSLNADLSFHHFLKVCMKRDMDPDAGRQILI